MKTITNLMRCNCVISKYLNIRQFWRFVELNLDVEQLRRFLVYFSTVAIPVVWIISTVKRFRSHAIDSIWLIHKLSAYFISSKQKSRQFTWMFSKNQAVFSWFNTIWCSQYNNWSLCGTSSVLFGWKIEFCSE